MYKFKKYSVEEYLEAVKESGYALRYVPEEVQIAHPEICLEAVKQDELALQFVRNQTEQICIEAVKQNGYVLRYVEKFYPSLLGLSSPFMEEYRENFAKEIEELEKKQVKEITMEELEEHYGCKVRIIK